MKKRRRYSGRFSPAVLTTVGSVVAAVALVVLLRWPWPRQAGAHRQTLVVYCAAGLKPPVEAAAREYEKAYGVAVQLQYGGSGTLLGNMRTARTGDLYIVADQTHLAQARGYGLTAEVLPLARQTPVIAVARGNPKRIGTIADLLRDDVRLSLANPDAAAIGSAAKSVLEKSGQWAAIETRVRTAGVFKPTVNDIANDIKVGAADAGIVWDSTVRQYQELEAVSATQLDQAVQLVSAAVLKSSIEPTAALRFARYLAASDRGVIHLRKNGYEAAEGDPWADMPELILYSGAMLRPAIEKTLKDFEQREGVRLTTVYNGCGILTAQMRAGERPDAYFACDSSFMDTVADLYISPRTLASNDIMIIVPKGNPKAIHTVADLTRGEPRLGLAHPEKSAMGALTKNLLVAMKLYEAIQRNTKVVSATGDFLVNQLRTGSLDAIIACRSNAVAAMEHLDAIAIDHPLARAMQPYAVGKASRYKQLMSRLLDVLQSAESKERFVTSGFGWVDGQVSP